VPEEKKFSKEIIQNFFSKQEGVGTPLKDDKSIFLTVSSPSFQLTIFFDKISNRYSHSPRLFTLVLKLTIDVDDFFKS
jgi:hypothetical protein